MILRFATKSDIYGNRKYLILDTEQHTMSRSPRKILCKEELIEVSTKEMKYIEYDIKLDATPWYYVDNI